MRRTLPPQTIKVCACCKVEKPASEFSSSSRKWGRLHSYCHPCQAAKTREYNRRHREKDPAAHKQKEWARHITRTFGITADQYHEMLVAQNGVCAICNDPAGDATRLAVDHCHVTGAVRGLLCVPCNASLGAFKDSTWILNRAIEYLTRSSGAAVDDTIIEGRVR